jgi:site-specific recombinase
MNPSLANQRPMLPLFVQRWFRSSQDRLGLDILLGQAPQPLAPLRQRLDWMRRLVNWVRTVGPNATELGQDPGRVQVTRLKHILNVLDRNPELKAGVARTLRSIIHDTHALELFMNVGIPNQEGFIGEFVERLNVRFLPQPPRDQDLVSVFSETFKSWSDSEWIKQMDPATFRGWLDLFLFSDAPVNPDWNTLVPDASDALFLLAETIRALGLSRLVRNRVAEGEFRKLPFFILPERAQALLEAKDDATRTLAYADFRETLDLCFASLDEVTRYFHAHGVSIALVYQVGRLRAMLKRSGTLARLLTGYQDDPRFIQEFLGLLVQENIRARSFKGFLQDNLVLVSQKIVETNAEVGEHYITRDRDEQASILKKSMGGGWITGFTTALKFLLGHLSAPPFISGFISVANYSVSFLAIQFMGFTLATKQPAMTASTLASKIHGDGSVDDLVDEILHLIRSQVAAVAGNLIAVVPTVLALEEILSLTGHELTDADHALHTIQSFSLLGMTPFYAAFTGVLLWLSSIFAGWFGNWFSYRGLPEAIEHQPRLIYVFGAHRTQRFSLFLRNHVSGVAASVSLAFLLGMTPHFATFFGLPLDVRHVTLSSGALTASVYAIGASVFSGVDFWLAVGGIASMAVLNLAVAFALALMVALWAKNAAAPRRRVVYQRLFDRIARKPWIVLVP